jgi:hypothetical protein
MQRNTTLWFRFGVASCAIALLLWGMVTLWNHFGLEAKRASARSTAAALLAAIAAESRMAGRIGELGKSSDKRLTLTEFDELIRSLAAKYELDPPRNWRSGQPLVDPWGNRFVVSARRVDKVVQWSVCSGGEDGEPGTEDDICTKAKLSIDGANKRDGSEILSESRKQQ